MSGASPEKPERSPIGNRIALTSLWLGIALGLSGLILIGYNPMEKWVVSILEFISLVLLGTFFVIRFEAVKLFAGRRSTRMGANSVLMIAIFMAIVGILNFLSSRHSQRIDLSETRKFTLAPQTEKVLDALQREVKVTAFSQASTASEREIMDLLASYAHRGPLFSYKMVDPDRNPAIARNYGITLYDTLVLESGQQETQVKEVSEEALTNAIIRVGRDERRKLFFLTDHGEHAMGDPEKDGYSHAKDALEKQGYEVGELSLLTEGQVPDDVRVLILAGPQKPFMPQEKTAMANYLDRGGKVLALLDPQVEINLDDFLLEWGVRAGPGFIVDTISRLFGGDLTIPIVNTYPPHEITEGFDIATFFPLVQSITYDSPDPSLTFHPLAQTTPNSWSKTDISGPEVRIDPNRDPQGPFTVGGIITREPNRPPTDPFQEDQAAEENSPVQDNPVLIVFGDSDFASNAAFYFSGNGDLFLNTINYLARESHLIAITPKDHQFSPLFLSRTQGQIMAYVSLMVIPGIVFFTGFIVWRRRRRL